MPGEPRTPPHSVEAEQSVLGGLMLDAAAWDSVGDVLTAEDFYRPDHRLIFESIALLAGEGKACDVITVSEQLERAGRLDDAGGLAYVGKLALEKGKGTMVDFKYVDGASVLPNDADTKKLRPAAE